MPNPSQLRLPFDGEAPEETRPPDGGPGFGPEVQAELAVLVAPLLLDAIRRPDASGSPEEVDDER
ncbi:MAG: hypothetical protein ACI9WU_002563 [Myxococcota bacterium]